LDCQPVRIGVQPDWDLSGVQLHFRQYGQLNTDRAPLVLLHGLLGSSANWHGVASRLEREGHVLLVPDQRNHGRSPHDSMMDYPLMAADLMRLLDQLELEQVVLIGHSMGAKTAMWLALNYPSRVESLVVVDMAPVSNPNRFDVIFDALESLDLLQLSSRQQADEHLGTTLPSSLLRQYLLQNLVRDEQRWYWRINLPVLAASLTQILDFPVVESGCQFQGNTLFLYGGESDYVTSSVAAPIRNLFPYARLRAVPGAGHWVYAERPEEFHLALSHFLAHNDRKRR
jgi:esterase